MEWDGVPLSALWGLDGSSFPLLLAVSSLMKLKLTDQLNKNQQWLFSVCLGVILRWKGWSWFWMTSENLAFAILTTCFTATCPKFQSHFIFPNKGVSKIIVLKLLQHLWTLHSLLSPRSQCPRPTTTGEKTELVVPSRPGITCTTDFSNFLFPPGPSTTDSVTHTGSLFLSICRNHRLFCPLNLSGLTKY